MTGIDRKNPVQHASIYNLTICKPHFLMINTVALRGAQHYLPRLSPRRMAMNPGRSTRNAEYVSS